MPRTEEDNQLIREGQARKILDAARKVFAHKGLAATKISDIAVAADVSYGLVYHYFPNKEKIFAELVERAMNGMIAVAQHAQEMAGTPWEKIHWMASRMLTGMEREPEAIMISLQVYTSDAVPQEIREVVSNLSNQFVKIIRQLIEEGQAAGQVVQGDPDQLTTLYGYCLQGLAMGVTFFNETSIVQNIPDVDMFLRMLKAW
jgi:AcrR family transcriptional regulator